MFKDQLLPTYLSAPVNSMEELFDFIETDNFYPFIPNSSMNQTTTYLTLMQKFDNDQNRVSFQINPDEIIGLEDMSTVSSSDDSESSSECVNLPTSDDEDKQYFDLNEWMIQDRISRKLRPLKLYEFLRLLLNNPRYVSYASWLNKNEGLFKIHRPSEVACLWKKTKIRKAGGSMDYYTFARGIRYYYKTGAMIKTRTRHTYCFARV